MLHGLLDATRWTLVAASVVLLLLSLSGIALNGQEATVWGLFLASVMAAGLATVAGAGARRADALRA